MKFIIDKNTQILDQIRPIFRDSYTHLLLEKVDLKLEEAFNVCDFISCLYENGKLICFSFHREMHIRDHREPPQYLNDAPTEFLKFIEKKFHLMTTEWLTVAPEKLGKFSKVQPADLMLGLGMNFMRESIYNGAVGISRQDTKVDILTTRFGSRICGTVQRLGIPCSIVFIEDFGVKPHPIRQTQEKINILLKEMTNHIPWIERKKVA